MHQQPRALRVVPDHAAAPAAAPDGLAPASVLNGLARELAAAQEMALDLQVTVAALIAPAGNAPVDVLFRLQDLDLLSQTLKDLSTFAAAIGADMPEGWKIDTAAATRALHLRGLASRLATGEAPQRAAPAAEAPGGGEDDDFLL